MIKTLNMVRAVRALVREGLTPDEAASRFVAFVHRMGIEQRVPQFLAVLARVEAYDRGEQMLTVRAATPPTREVLAEVAARLGAPAGVPVEIIDDPSVLGGVRAMYGDRHLDASVARQIARVRHAITGTHFNDH